MILEPEKRIPTGNNNKYDIVRNNGGKKKNRAKPLKCYNTKTIYCQPGILYTIKNFPKLWLNKNIFR